MNSDQSETLESNIPRRGRPRKNLVSSPPKKKSSLTLSLTGVRKPKHRAVKVVLPNVPATVQNLAKVTNKSTEIIKTFPIVSTKDSPPITTFLLTPTAGKTGTLAPVSKSGSVPMTLVQHVSSDSASMKQLPVGVSSNILPRVQVSSSTGSTPKLLLITTASSSSSVSIPTASVNQTLCKSLLPVKLSNNTSSSNSVVAANHGKPVLYKIPPSQSSGMVLLSTTTPAQSGGAPKKYLLIPSSTTKRQSNAAMIVNSKLSYSVADPNSDKSVITVTPPIQTPSNAASNSNKIPTTTVPMFSSSLDTTSKKLTRQSAVSPSKQVNTSRRRGSVLGANSTISSIPSGIFKTVACTTNSRGICSTPVGVQTSQKQSNVKLSQVGDFVTDSSLIKAPMQHTFNQDASLNITIPIVPQASLKTNHLTQSPNCSIIPVNKSKLLQTSQSQPNAAGASTQCAKHSRALPGQRARKTISKIDKKESTSSFITVPSSLPFSAIQLKPNCPTASLSASSFSGLSWIVSPNTAYQQMPSLDSENATKDPNISAQNKNMPKLIVMNGVSNSNFSTPQSANLQTCNNSSQTGMFSASHHTESSRKQRLIYASPPKLTIAPAFSTPDMTASMSDKNQHPSELMIIKEREEFIDDSLEISNLEDLSPPKLQREDEPDLNGPFNFDISSPIQSSSIDCLPPVKSTSSTQPRSSSESDSALTIAKQHQSFYEIKSMIPKDPTLASLSAVTSNTYSEFISHLDKDTKLSFDQLFNHFKLLADKKKKASSHSAIMLQVAHSIHCCVVLIPTDVEGSVDLKDMPSCVEKSLKCSVKCRQAFMKRFFPEKAISIDPQFNLPILKSTDSVDEQSAVCHHSKGETNSSSANETLHFSSTVIPELLNIKTELTDYEEYLSDDQLESLPNSSIARKPNANLISEASTQKFATDIDETFSSFSTCSDFRCLTPSSQNSYSDCLTPNEPSTSTNQFFHSAFPKECSNLNSCINSCLKAKNNERFHFCNVKCKTMQSSIPSSQHKIKGGCNNENELAPVLNVSSPSSNSQVLAGKLRYKIVPKGHISLSGKNSNPQIKSNCMENPDMQNKVPVQSYIINSDKSSLNPLQTISSILTCSTEMHKNETKNLTGSNLNKKQKRKQSHLKTHGDNSPTKKMRTSEIKEIPSKEKSPKKPAKESCSKSSHSTKTSLPLVERPLSVRDPKHLYDEPTTVDRVVMLTPEGKPILTDSDLQITFDDSLSFLSSPKKKVTLTKSPKKKSSSILKNSLPSSTKGKVQNKHSKSSSKNNQLPRPPTLKFLLRELETKCKYKYISSSASMANSIKPNDSMFHKDYSVSEKSKKANIEQITNNIASGFPAFGPGSPRCTMKLYKYFVSTRIKNRAKKNGSHEIDTPLTLYINWKTLSRQPFNKHRITNHTLNVMAIKNAKQFSNYKKCKSRSRMCKPVKNKPLFMKKRKALMGVHSRQTKSKSNKSKKKTNKKHSKFILQQPWSKKKKLQITKTSSTKKKAPVSNLSHQTKMEETILIKKENSPELDPIIKKKKSKSLVNNNEDKQNKTLKPAWKKIKRSKHENEKRAIKKCSSITKTTKSKRVLLESPNANLEKVEPFCETSSQTETRPEKRKRKKAATRTAKLNQQEILNEQGKSNESPLLPSIKHLKDENLPSGSKCADPIMEEEKPVETKPDITTIQANLQENKEAEIISDLIPTYSTNIKTEVTLQEKHHGQKKLTSSNKKHYSNVVTQQFTKVPEMLISEKDPDIDTSTQTLSLTSANNPVNENAEVASQLQLSSPTKIENSGSFIYEDYVELSLTVMDNAPMSDKQEKQFDIEHSSLSVDNNQPAISNENSYTPFINVTPTIRSSAFSDKFDVGLSPELARIQKLKDQLQEKQKALDLAKLHLK